MVGLRFRREVRVCLSIRGKRARPDKGGNECGGMGGLIAYRIELPPGLAQPGLIKHESSHWPRKVHCGPCSPTLVSPFFQKGGPQEVPLNRCFRSQIHFRPGLQVDLDLEQARCENNSKLTKIQPLRPQLATPVSLEDS